MDFFPCIIYCNFKTLLKHKYLSATVPKLKSKYLIIIRVKSHSYDSIMNKTFYPFFYCSTQKSNLLNVIYIATERF